MDVTLVPQPDLAFPGIFGIFLSIGLSVVAGMLMRRNQPDTPDRRNDDQPTTLSTRGSWFPLVIGRARIAPVFAWAGDRRVIIHTERVGGGLFSSGKKVETGRDYTEDGWHLLCVGTVTRVNAIYANGERITDFAVDITGNSVSIESDKGLVQIVSGGDGQNPHSVLGRSGRVGVKSRWPNACYAVWENYDLGPSPNWPQIEYDIEVHCPSNSLTESNYLLEAKEGHPSEGVNPAHAIYQLLTAERPRGAGIDPDLIDKASLEAMGVQMEEEHIPLNMHFADGETVEEAMEAILTDCGYLMAEADGRLVFMPIREPGEEETIPQFTSDTTIPPLPEIEQSHTAKRPTSITFTFRNERRSFKTYDIKNDDDGHIDAVGGGEDQTVPIRVCTRGEAAVKIAARRESEFYGDRSAVSLSVNRGGRLLIPGRLIDVADVGRIRVMGVQIFDDRPEAKISGIFDGYSLPARDSEFDEGVEPPELLEPEPDIAFDWYELPEGFASEEGVIIVFRVAAHNQISGATVWGSIDGGASYSQIGSQHVACAGGVLLESIASGASDIEEGPIYEAQDDKSADVLNLAANTAAWEAGQQLVRINDEIMYLREVEVQEESDWEPETAYTEGDAVVPTGEGVVTGLRYVCTTTGTSGTDEPEWPAAVGDDPVTDGTAEWEARYFRYQMLGLKRAQMGTSDAGHAADDQVYITPSEALTTISSVLINPGATLHVKTQPQANGGEVDLGDVTAVSKAIAGFGS